MKQITNSTPDHAHLSGEPKGFRESYVRSISMACVAFALIVALALMLTGCEQAVEPKDPPPRNGSIEVKSDPPGAAISLNERNTGERTPHVFDDLAPGSYTILLTLDGRVPWGPETVEVTAGQTNQVNVTLRAITVTLSIDDLTVTEGDSGTTAAVFEVTMSAASGQQVTADYETANGTATAGVDYQAKSGTLTFAPGDTRKTILVVVQGDTVEEGDETFTVTLRNPSHAKLATATATGTIVNDDESASCTDIPTETSSPSPADGATAVSRNADLSWSSGQSHCGHDVTYEVHFGTDPSPDSGEYKGTTSSRSWPLPPLLPDTRYYWAIHTEDSNGTRQGPTWDFTTDGSLVIGDGIIVRNTGCDSGCSPGPGTDSLQIRTSAGTGYDTIAYAADGATGTLVDGPRRANGYTWWKINWNHSNRLWCEGVVGCAPKGYWSAEANSTHRWLNYDS